MYNATYDGEKCTSRQLEKGIVCLSMSIRSRVTTKNVKKQKIQNPWFCKKKLGKLSWLISIHFLLFSKSKNMVIKPDNHLLVSQLYNTAVLTNRILKLKSWLILILKVTICFLGLYHYVGHKSYHKNVWSFEEKK